MRTTGRERKIWMGVLVVLALAAGLVLAPFLPWFVLALWTAGLMRPTVDRLTTATGGRAGASGLAVVALLVVISVPLALFSAFVALDAFHLGQSILKSSSGRAALVQLVSSSSDDAAGTIHDMKTFEPEVLTALFREHGVEALNAATLLAGALGGLLLGVFVYFVATYAALVHGRDSYLWVESQLPVSPRRLQRMRDAFFETGRGLLFSVVMTGVIQALVSTVAYYGLSVPRAAGLGFATFLASLVPSIGTALVWGPLSIALLVAGQTTKGVILLLIGVFVVSSVDNALRPLFARWGSLTLNPFLVLFSMLGGVLTMGGWGLMLGPLVVRLMVEALKLFAELQQRNENNLAREAANAEASSSASLRTARNSWLPPERRSK